MSCCIALKHSKLTHSIELRFLPHLWRIGKMLEILDVLDVLELKASITAQKQIWHLS